MGRHIPPERRAHHRRHGFTLLEVLAVVVLLGIIAGIALPATAGALSQIRASRAASIIASDLQSAFSMAAREKEPLVLTVNAAGRSYTLANRAGAVLLNRRMGATSSDATVTTMSTTAGTATFFPNGMASASVRITVGVNEHTRQVDMSRVGLVRVSTP